MLPLSDAKTGSGTLLRPIVWPHAIDVGGSDFIPYTTNLEGVLHASASHACSLRARPFSDVRRRVPKLKLLAHDLAGVAPWGHPALSEQRSPMPDIFHPYDREDAEVARTYADAFARGAGGLVGRDPAPGRALPIGRPRMRCAQSRRSRRWHRRCRCESLAAATSSSEQSLARPR